MPDHVDPAVLVDLLESRSSILHKVPDEHRRLMNRALMQRPPRSYRAVYKAFHLKDFCVSFTSFYCYARRVRLQAGVAASLESVIPGGPASRAAASTAQEMVLRRLFDALTDPDVSPTVIHRLLGAWRLIGRIGEPSSAPPT